MRPFRSSCPSRRGQILACGAELKNTFCLTRDDFAFLSQHIGDMENLETLEHFEAYDRALQAPLPHRARVVAYDLHPDYSATKYAAVAAGRQRRNASVAVQHHHAHIAACLADNGWLPDDGPVIGVAWDGTGYGLDGHIWGGEFLVGGLWRLPAGGAPGVPAHARRRRGHPQPLAAGPRLRLCAYRPGRSSLPGIDAGSGADVVRQQVDRGLNTPLTSAAGRLFDAVAALLGVRQQVTYEAQAAIELEMAGQPLVWPAWPPETFQPPYPFDLEEGDDGYRDPPALLRRGHPGTTWHAGLEPGRDRLALSPDPGRHDRDDVCQRIAAETGLRTVALSGGCFQNRLLLALTVPRLEQQGLHVAAPPPGTLQRRRHQPGPGSPRPLCPSKIRRETMKYIDEFRDPALARRLLARIEARATHPVRLMEFCGGHTHAIMRYGLRSCCRPRWTCAPGRAARCASPPTPTWTGPSPWPRCRT